MATGTPKTHRSGQNISSLYPCLWSASKNSGWHMGSFPRKEDRVELFKICQKTKASIPRIEK